MSEAELDRFLLGLLSYLASSTHVTDVRSRAGAALGESDIKLWEQKRLRKLPEDLKQFYLTFDGFSVEWDVNVHGASAQLGKIVIPTLSKLKKLAASDLKPLCTATSTAAPPSGTLLESTPTGHSPKIVDNAHKLGSALVLDSCEHCGTTCIVFSSEMKEASSATYSICLKSPSGEWVPLAPSLAHYLRLATVHLGIQGWPLKLTSGYIVPHLRVWYSLCLPSNNITSSTPESESGIEPTYSEYGCRPFNDLNTTKLTAMFNSSLRRPTSQEDKQQESSSVRKTTRQSKP